MGKSQSIMLHGYAAAAPELRYTQNGTAVANLRIATNKSWKRKGEDEWQKKTSWHRCIFFGETAEKAAQLIKKGDKVLLLDGEMDTRSWEDSKGVERWTTEVTFRNFEVTRPKSGEFPTLRKDEKPEKAEPPMPEPAMGDDVPF